MLGHYRPSITRQDYEPYLLYTAKKDEDMPKEPMQSELQQAANALDNLRSSDIYSAKGELSTELNHFTSKEEETK